MNRQIVLTATLTTRMLTERKGDRLTHIAKSWKILPKTGWSLRPYRPPTCIIVANDVNNITLADDSRLVYNMTLASLLFDEYQSVYFL